MYKQKEKPRPYGVRVWYHGTHVKLVVLMFPTREERDEYVEIALATPASLHQLQYRCFTKFGLLRKKK